MKNIVYFNGQFLPYNRATLPLATHALHYGTGCFEGIRGYFFKNQLIIFRLKDHYDRLKKSAQILHMTAPDIDLCGITIDLLKKNRYKENVYIRPLIYKSSETITEFNLEKLTDGFAIYTCPLGHYLDVNQGIKALVSSWERVSSRAIPPQAKPTGLYLNSCLAKTEAEKRGAKEAILLNPDGSISEGSAENIFLVFKNELVTPSADQNILEGITRNTILQLARREFKLKTTERKVMAEELKAAEEIFLTGTGAEITPVGRPGPVTTSFQTLYFDIVRGKVNRYRHWLTYAG
jgi:branched-chain amino acid aminotransferase